MLLLISIFLRHLDACNILKNDLEISISTYENMYWEIKDELIEGELTKFRLEGDQNGTYFKLQQPNDIYDQKPFPYFVEIQEIIKARSYRKGEFWMNEYSLLGQDSQGFHIYIIQDEKFGQLSLHHPCSDFDYLDENNFVVACHDNQNLIIEIINKNGTTLHAYSKFIQQKSRINLAIYKTTIPYLLIYIPAYEEEVVSIQSTIKVFIIDSFQIQETPYYLDKQKLSELFQNELKYFSVIDVKIYAKKLFVLDYRLGPISLVLDGKGNFTNAKLMTSSSYITEFYSFSIRNNNEIIVLGFVQKNQMSMRVLKNGRYDDVVRTFEKEDFTLGLCGVQITPQYYLINSNKELMIFDDKELVDKIQIYKGVFIANPSFDLYVFFHSNKAEFYEISSGILTVLKQIQKSDNQKYFKLFESKNANCYVDIVLQVYDKLDAKIHTNFQTNFYKSRIVYYPPYPQKYYTWPRITNGPNLQQQITLLKDQKHKIDIKFLSLSPLTITGISQFDQNNVIFSLINNNQGLNQYLVQTENLSAFIYVCELNELEQKCSQKSTFFPLIKLVEDNIKWTEVGMHDSYIGIKTQNNHVVTIYKLGDSKIVQIFQIKTSLQDERTQITDFAINANFVFVLITGMDEIQIYSLSLKQQIDTISNLSNAQKVYVSNTFNKNLLFIKCNNIIIIGHYVNEFNFISQIQVTDQQNVQLLLSIFRSTLVIVYKTVTEQGILQYLIHNLNSVTLLRRLPLYYYQLPQKLQLASNPLKNLIMVTAYSVYTQTTVILVYQINEYQRNSLLTVIDTFDYFESELNYCVAGMDDTVIQFIYKGNVYSYLYFKQPRIYFNQVTDPSHFQTTLKLQQQEWNDYYNLRREYNKDITLVDMQLEMEWVKTNINLRFEECEKVQSIQIDNNWIQGQRIQYKLSCILCTTDNDGGQIYLLNQFQKSNRQIQTKSIQEIMKFDQNYVLILSELTGTKQYLQFVDNSGDIANEIELQSEQQGYVASKLFLLTKQILVVLYENKIERQTELWYYYCWEEQERQDCKVMGKMEFQQRKIITEMRYFNNVQIILTEGQTEHPSIYFYSLELDDKLFAVQQFKLIINKDYFHENFNVTSFDVMKLTENEGCLILAEFRIGIIALKMTLTKEEVSVQQYQYMLLPFIQQKLVEPQENRLIKVEIFKEGNNNCNLILVDEINESYQMNLNYEKGVFRIQIVQVFQKLGNIVKLRSIGVLDHYLIQLYRYENKNYYCLYDIEETEDLRSNAGICKAGLKQVGYDGRFSYNFVVRKNQIGKYQLLISTYEDRILQLYTIDSAARIVVRNSEELRNYTVNLIAVNPYKQVQMAINITLQSCPIADQDMTLFFILLIVVLGILLVGIIVCVAIHICINKHRKRRRSYKAIQ
ncbi:unnamed protein product (macronuclear) [Paramecium tetraurelia]|uniref:Transmembrane protein n=1 Tax=Paramecium tetraurelia TaxID=5888 RepID=A0CCY7_PARTE|nr:uncharacterized protein GSPATT00037439001 [Paramecium tetraurelia]CAK68654.1 unnamed protein product [Paramecium tetraurelia]|eukprot:XP_001436051.1 hypothetical protein (macronuclear) [Paramecium tetraurelia strain d4-2]